MNFYTEEQKVEIKRLFSLPTDAATKEVIKAYGNTIGRTYAQMYQQFKYQQGTSGRHKGSSYVKKANRVSAPIVKADKQSARTNGSEVRFKFSNVSVDMENKEVVFTIGK